MTAKKRIRKKKIVSQKVSFDEKGQSLLTKFSDGSILSEPMTAAEASQWEAEHKY